MLINSFRFGGAVTPPLSQPASFFGQGQQGFAFNVQDLTTVWADTGRTTNATVGDEVFILDDLSGNGNGLSQVISIRTPILRQEAGGGLYYLEFDGNDDTLAIPASGVPWGILGDAFTSIAYQNGSSTANQTLISVSDFSGSALSKRWALTSYGSAGGPIFDAGGATNGDTRVHGGANPAAGASEILTGENYPSVPSQSVRRNGVTVDSNSTAVSVDTTGQQASIGAAFANADGGVYINDLTGKIYCGIFLVEQVSAAKRDDIEAWLEANSTATLI